MQDMAVGESLVKGIHSRNFKFGVSCSSSPWDVICREDIGVTLICAGLVDPNLMFLLLWFRWCIKVF